MSCYGTANMQFSTSNIWISSRCFCTKRTVKSNFVSSFQMHNASLERLCEAPLNTSANNYRYQVWTTIYIYIHLLYKLCMVLPKGSPWQTARLISSRGWSRWKSAKRQPPLRSCVALISALASALVTKVCATSAHTLSSVRCFTGNIWHGMSYPHYNCKWH